ncbi:hypothetical protein MRX96_058967 [Rhipicephalus microplus]
MAATMPSPSSPPSNVAVHRDRATSAEKRHELSRGGKSIAMELAPRRACSDVGHHRRSSTTAFNGVPRIQEPRPHRRIWSSYASFSSASSSRSGPNVRSWAATTQTLIPSATRRAVSNSHRLAQPHYRRRSSVDTASASSASTCSTIRSSSSSSSSSSSNSTGDHSPTDCDHDALLREVLRLFEAGLDGNGGPVLLRHEHIAELASMSSMPGGEEPEPHFTVGPWGIAECGICLETVPLYRRPCCNFPACTPCLKRYYASRVRQNNIQIECCNVRCHQFVSRDEISARLPADSKDHFHRLLVTANVSTKTCPPLQPRHPASQTRQPASQVRRLRRLLVLRLPRALARGP